MLIYEALNKNNGKVYIGLTTKTLKERKSSHIRSARAKDKYPLWVFELKTYKEAKSFGVPKTTWYRHKKT